MNVQNHIDLIDGAVETMAADPDVEDEAYFDALEELRHSIDARILAER